MSGLPQITDVQRLRLEPGDSLMIRVAEDLTMEQAAHIQDQVRRILGLDNSVPVLVLPHGVSVEVLERKGRRLGERVKSAH